MPAFTRLTPFAYVSEKITTGNNLTERRFRDYWDELWRVRVGDYRIIYSIEEARLVVLVVKIGHRREGYRGEWS